MDEYGDYLLGVANDARQDRTTRKLAAVLLKQWQSGLVPSPRRLVELRKMVDRSHACSRLQEDGTCAWLRKFAHLEGLPVPEPGMKMRCHRQLDGTDAQRYDACAGFIRQRE